MSENCKPFVEYMGVYAPLETEFALTFNVDGRVTVVCVSRDTVDSLFPAEATTEKAFEKNSRKISEAIGTAFVENPPTMSKVIIPYEVMRELLLRNKD